MYVNIHQGAYCIRLLTSQQMYAKYILKKEHYIRLSVDAQYNFFFSNEVPRL